MSYIPTTWRSGDIVTSEKLNKLETGMAQIVAPEKYIIAKTEKVTGEYDEVFTLDKTASEINNAIENGKMVFIKMDETTVSGNPFYTFMPIIAFVKDNNGAFNLYQTTTQSGNCYTFFANSLNGYPTGMAGLNLTQSFRDNTYNGLLIVQTNQGETNKTAAEIINAMNQGILVGLLDINDFGYQDQWYGVITYHDSDNQCFYLNDPYMIYIGGLYYNDINDYPSLMYLD